MADGDHYAAYASVRELLSNDQIGVAGATLYDDGSLERALDITMAILHNYLGLTTMTKVGDAVDLVVLEGIQCDLINMQILRARNMKENNIGDIATTIQYWSVTPYLTREHKMMLDQINAKLEGSSFVYNVKNGTEVL